MHEAVSYRLSLFEYKHLPVHLQEVSKPFCDLAHLVAHTVTGPMATAALDKLWEAKNCAVVAAGFGKSSIR